MWQLVVSKLYSRSVGGAGEVELLDRRHLRALKVSCGWWRPGHVTPVLASDWSPCPGSVRHHPCAGLHLRPHPGRAQPPGLPGQLSGRANIRAANDPSVFTITEKAPTRAFSWLKAHTSAFTFKTLLRHYAKRALTPRSLNVKLDRQRKGHKGRAVWLA